MRLPDSPTPSRLTRLSFSQYEAGRACLARLAWATAGLRAGIPVAPSAILGTAFHLVLRQAHRGLFRPSPGTVEITAVARAAFDQAVRGGWEQAHPLLRLKFPEPGLLPFYNIRREQAAGLAAQIATSRGEPWLPQPKHPAGPPASERWLESGDGLLFGRADYLDKRSSAVVDYKTGHVDPATAEGLTASEQRQLRFYGGLAADNGVRVTKGVIMRAAGARTEVAMYPSEMEDEGRAARAVLARYNSAVELGVTFDALATPSATSCSHCDCIPFCEAFWARAEPTWAESCGSHVDGSVSAVTTLTTMGVRLVQIRLGQVRGTHGTPDVVIEQVPAAWMELEGGHLPTVAQRIRATECRPVRDRPTALRADKTGTAIWTVGA